MSYHLIEVLNAYTEIPVYKLTQEGKFLKKIYISIKESDKGVILSPALFNIYIDDLLINRKHKAAAGVLLERNLYLNTLLFADDQAVIQD